MPDTKTIPAPAAPPPRREPDAIAKQALAEAQRRQAQEHADRRAAETQGRGGLDPVRYGDWEVRGIATDF